MMVSYIKSKGFRNTKDFQALTSFEEIKLLVAGRIAERPSCCQRSSEWMAKNWLGAGHSWKIVPSSLGKVKQKRSICQSCLGFKPHFWLPDWAHHGQSKQPVSANQGSQAVRPTDLRNKADSLGQSNHTEESVAFCQDKALNPLS